MTEQETVDYQQFVKKYMDFIVAEIGKDIPNIKNQPDEDE